MYKMPETKKRKSKSPPKEKRFCVKNQTTKRCILSHTKDNTSPMCSLFKITQRCRAVKAESTDFVVFKSYKMKKSVLAFLNKKVVNVPLEKLKEKAEKDVENYEYNFKYVFEDKRKTEEQMKDQFLEELVELAHHAERDNNGSHIITMKSLKYAIEQNNAFKFLI